MSDDRIEAAAIAIWLVFTGRLKRGKAADASFWNRLRPVIKQQYRDEAEAALRAAGAIK